MVYSKYHSALANGYIHRNQDDEFFEHFLQHWKQILQLKWSLKKCKQVGCTSTHLAKAHFGHGNYRHSAKLLNTLLQSKSLQSNRRVQLFILLYESYMRLGEVEKASHLLTKDHLLSKFPSITTINATDHGNSTSMSVLFNDDHSAVWLLDQECMTISSENYKTCKILAAFYTSLGSKDAATLEKVFTHVLRHYLRRLRVDGNKSWWWDHAVYPKVVSSDSSW